MAENITVTPGFFGLPLGFFKADAYEQYQARITNCKWKLESRTHGMHAAVFNLQGMLYYSIRQVGNALDAFKRALDIDPDGLNALENIRHIYELLGRSKDAHETSQRVKTIISDPLARARCLAEQGYALGFGEIEVQHGERLDCWRDAAERYSRAIKLAETKVEPGELANWYLCIAVFKQKIGDRLYRERLGRDTEYTECIESCLKAYELTKDQDESHSHLHAMSLRLLGTLKSKDSFLTCIETINTLVEAHGASSYYSSPEESFKKALELDPDHQESYTRYAKVLFREFCYKKMSEKKKQETLGKAISLLNQYIDRHQPAPSEAVTDLRSDLWFPLVTRGRMYLQLYRYKYDRDVKNLHKARSDLTTALKIQRTSDALVELGEVCQLIAMHPLNKQSLQEIQSLSETQKKEHSEYMNEALTHFLDATLCLDGNKSYIHSRYAYCFADYGEHRSAVESFKKAFELNNIPTATINSFNGFVKSLFKLHEEGTDRDDLMAELAYWLDYVVVEKNLGKELADIVEGMFRNHKDAMKTVLHQLAIWKKSETLTICLQFHDDHTEAKKLKLAAMSSLSASADEWVPTSTSINPSTRVCSTGNQAAISSETAMLPSMETSVAPIQAPATLISTSASRTQASAAPTQASAAPTQASAAPTQASEAPTQASAAPTQASAAPTQASEAPTQASEAPTQASAAPTQVSAAPTQVSVAPTQVSAAPTQASAAPTQASTAQTQASGVPTSPSAGSAPTPVAPPKASASLMQACISPTGNSVVEGASTSVTPYNELLQLIPPPLLQAKNHHGKTYDFFVSFSRKDAQWVYRSLLPRCEEQSRFKGCIADRDYPLGRSIFENIESSFENSVCTILVFTPHFLESGLCTHELDQVLFRARTNKHKMIPIKLEECDVPAKVAALTYLDATCAVDWDRLLRNLDLCCINEETLRECY